MLPKRPLCSVALVLALSIASTAVAWGQPAKPGVKGYEVEWVYRVKYGFIDEWWDIYRKYQIPVLDRQKQLGQIIDYKIYHPMFHVDEAARWDYRVEIVYRDQNAAALEGEVANALFGSDTGRKAAENRRWELTTNHWDLPIYQVDTTRSR